MPCDDAVADRQPQPGPLPHRFGREERVEETRQIVDADRRPVIGEASDDYRVALLGGDFQRRCLAGRSRIAGVPSPLTKPDLFSLTETDPADAQESAISPMLAVIEVWLRRDGAVTRSEGDFSPTVKWSLESSLWFKAISSILHTVVGDTFSGL